MDSILRKRSATARSSSSRFVRSADGLYQQRHPNASISASQACACLRVHTWILTSRHLPQTYTYMIIHAYIHARTHARMHAYIHTLHIHAYVHTYIHTYIHSSIHIHTHTHIHIYIYMYTYTHTYIFTHVRAWTHAGTPHGRHSCGS